MIRDSAAVADAPAPPVNQYSVKLISQYLDSLSSHCQGNPDHLLTLRQFPRIALESPSVRGGKYWLGVAMETGVSIRWGSTGKQGTVKHVSLPRCRCKNPALELKVRILEKLRQGYDLIPHETVLP